MTYDFYTLLGQKEITIPAIQRDFAQGRDSAVEIRLNFLEKLKEVLTAPLNTPTSRLHLDFVYGYLDSVGHFVPLDGQQRLTTLFLLHWYAGARTSLSLEDAETVKRLLTRYSYETRVSSKRFCNRLVSHPELASEPVKLSESISDSAWFVASWSNDPTVQAMLNMLDDIQTVFASVDELWKRLTVEKRITFEFIDIKSDEFKLTDELYIKMNSRGKPLSPFENFKAQFTNMLQGPAFKDKTLKLDNSPLTYRDYFAISIDGRWMDLFWRHFSPEKVDNALTAFILYIAEMLYYRNGQQEDDFKGDTTTLKNIFQRTENALFLFNSLDLIASLPSVTEFFADLFHNGEDDGKKVRLFDTGYTDLFGHCMEDSNFEVRNKMMLFAVLYFGIHNGTNDIQRLREALRLLRNLLIRVRQVNTKDRIRFSSNLRLPNFREHIEFIESFSLHWKNSEENIWTIFSKQKWKGFTKDQLDSEKRKARFLAVHPTFAPVVNRLEDHDQVAGIIDNFDLTPEGLHERVSAFLELWQSDGSDSLLVRSLLCYGDHSVKTHDVSALGDIYFLGSKGNWNRILTTNYNDEKDRVSNALGGLLNAYIDLTEGGRVDKLRKLIGQYSVKERDWVYYFITYHEMTSSYFERFNLLAWSWNNDFQIHSLGNAGRQPLSSYHLTPYLIAVYKRLDNEKKSTIYWGRFTDPSFMRITGKGDLYIQEDGWRFHARKDAITEELIGHFDLQVNGNDYLLKETDQEDRIQIALSFCKALIG